MYMPDTRKEASASALGTPRITQFPPQPRLSITLANEKAFSPSTVKGLLSLPMLLEHMVGCPASHAAHRPQLESVENTSWSPAWSVVTWSPTSSTTPAASWPSTTGVGNGMVPLTTLRSLWHKPAAPM